MCDQADLYLIHFWHDIPPDKLVWNCGQHEFRNDANSVFFFNHIDLRAGCLDNHAVRQVNILPCKLFFDGIVRNTAEDKVCYGFMEIYLYSLVLTDRDHPVHHQELADQNDWQALLFFELYDIIELAMANSEGVYI